MLTAESRRLADRFAEAGVLPFDRMSVLEARASVAAGIRLAGEPQPVERVEDVLADGADGRLPVRVYDPAPDERLPLVVYLHGGGWVTGGVEASDAPCRALALRTRCVVASVEYRLSPETKHPGPADDAYAATAWLAEHAGDWGADAERLVVMGESAGGNLAAATTLMARDRGGPHLAAQVLLYPPLVPARGSTFPSMQENAEGHSLTRGGMEWFWDHYLAREEDGRHAYAAPLLADDLSGLPPALVVVAEHDPLRDEGLAYAARLREAGVDCRTVSYDGALHGFFSMSRALSEGREVLHVVAERLEQVLPGR